MRRNLLLLLALVACGGDDKKNVDAAPPADAAVDAPPPPDPMAYCTDIQAHCTGVNAQYPSMDQCLGTTTSFAAGKIGDQVGNTLGCRAYHAGAPSQSDPTTHCIHAGPGGDQTNAAGTCGDACASFCNLEIKICGSTAAPLPSITPQYQDLAACMTACSGFDKTHLYKLGGTPTTPAGNSLACRMYHATNAAFYTKTANLTLTNTHCTHTAATPTGPCAGTAAP